MMFEDFLDYCTLHNFGVAAFNTYSKDGESYCYIMVAQKGDSGSFVKGEGFIGCLDEILDDMQKTIENIIWGYISP